jgi:serine/threonine protein kinase/tetratricopeptide (TPR) repeat protein
MSASPRKPRELFLAALKLPPERWDAYLDEACGADEPLRRRVRDLLDAHWQARSFLGPALREPGPLVDLPAAGEGPGTVLGPYKLLERIGEGGMGSVWMAEQSQPVQRKVALKVVKPGLDSAQVVARFEAERQALALMDHPNIAKVLDGGTTESGRPFFVMELVKGVPITRYCDEQQLPIRARLELMVPVCGAVQHAHQKGIIHRDLKPSNVLVASYDGRAVPLVIDFGIAKATGGKLTEHTLFTGFGQVVGTLEYMSPEQAQLNQLDIDTRSDVYALGVLLYELLTGTTPLQGKRTREAGLLEVLELIREAETPRPSARLSTLAELPSIAAKRALEPARLSGLVRGELDWIVMKALDKDRSRRYETASALAHDIERYLHDEPVLACPPSAGYRLRKFVRRNKAVLMPGAVLALAVLLGAGGLGWVARDQAARRRETERGVTAALAQAERLLQEGDRQMDHPERWQTTVALAGSAVQRAEELLAAGGATAALASRVRQASAAVDAARTDSSVLVELERIQLERAAVIDGHSQRALAAPRYAAVLQSYGVDLAAPDEAVARVRSSRLREGLLAALEDWWGITTDREESKRLAAVVNAVLGQDRFRARWWTAVLRRDRVALAKMAGEAARDLPPGTLVNLSRPLMKLKEWTTAEQLLRAAQERYPGHFWLNHSLGVVLLKQPARAKDAVRYLAAALALRNDSPGAHGNLGNALRAAGDLEGGLRAYQAALRIAPRDVIAHNNLGNALVDKGDLAGAIVALRKAIDLRPDFPEAHCNLGSALRMKGDLAGAVAACRKAIALRPDLAVAHYILGLVLRDRGDLKGAIAALRRAIALAPGLTAAHARLGNALGVTGDLAGAVAALRKAIALQPDHAQAHFDLGVALQKKGDLPGALVACRTAIALLPDRAEAHYNLGNILTDLGDLAGAVVAYRKAVALKPAFAKAHYSLGTALLATGDLSGAVAAYQKAIALQPDLAEAHCNLGHALQWQGALRQALPAFRRGHALGSSSPRWPYPSAEWVRKCERLIELDGQLPGFLDGKSTPSSAAERIELAELCALKRLSRTALRFYEEAFAAQPDLLPAHRYDAASVAALAGCGRGDDVASLDERERRRLLARALGWMRDELARRASQGKKNPRELQQTLRSWQYDPNLAGVRDAAGLSKLPEAERRAWKQLWTEVRQLLAQAIAPNRP